MLAFLLTQLGRYDESERMSRRIVEDDERPWGTEHPALLVTQRNLGITLCLNGKLEEAEQVHRRLLEARQKSLGEGHPDMFLSLYDIARVLTEQGENQEAEQMFRRAKEGYERIYGRGDRGTLQFTIHLGVALVGESAYLYIYTHTMGYSYKTFTSR